jgi:hypothetical protein
VLKYSSSLIVAMAVTLEPPIGIVIGWILHVTPLPGIWTCIGGFVLLLGTMWLNYVSDRLQKVLTAPSIENTYLFLLFSS